MGKAPEIQASSLNAFTMAVQEKVNSKLTSMQKLRFWKKEINLKKLKLCFEAVINNDNNDHYKKKMNIFFVCDKPIVAEYAANIIYKELEEIRPKVGEPYKLFITASSQKMGKTGVRIYALLGLVMNHLEKIYQGMFNRMWGEIRYTLNDKNTVFKDIVISADPSKAHEDMPKDLHCVFYQRRRRCSTDTLFPHSGSYIDENNNVIDTKENEDSEIARPLALLLPPLG